MENDGKRTTCERENNKGYNEEKDSSHSSKNHVECYKQKMTLLSKRK